MSKYFIGVGAELTVTGDRVEHGRDEHFLIVAESEEDAKVKLYSECNSAWHYFEYDIVKEVKPSDIKLSCRSVLDEDGNEEYEDLEVIT